MKKLILVILVTIITVMAASAEWRSVKSTEDCGSYGIVHFDFQFDDDIIIYSVDEMTRVYNVVQENLIPALQENITHVQKDIFYARGCEYARTHGFCFFQNSLGIKYLVVLQPNGNYTTYDLEGEF